MKKLKLNEKSKIPILGFGAYQITGEECYQAIRKALEVGYRHIDTAEMYGNEEEVGRAIKDSKIEREEIFITSKVWHSNLKKEDVFRAVEGSLKKLGTDYLDLYLIHWPNMEVPVGETLGAMDEIKNSGRAKAIGVANFTIKHLEEALKTDIEVSNNQVEFHPTLYQKELKSFCDEKAITITAHTPLGRGEELDLKAVKEIAEERGTSPAQVLINWLLKKEIIAIPRSKKPEHIEDNFGALEWEMTDKEEAKLDAVGGKNRVVVPPFTEF